jgi:hypothetical protein
MTKDIDNLIEIRDFQTDRFVTVQLNFNEAPKVWCFGCISKRLSRVSDCRWLLSLQHHAFGTTHAE